MNFAAKQRAYLLVLHKIYTGNDNQLPASCYQFAIIRFAQWADKSCQPKLSRKVLLTAYYILYFSHLGEKYSVCSLYPKLETPCAPRSNTDIQNSSPGGSPCLMG